MEMNSIEQGRAQKAFEYAKRGSQLQKASEYKAYVKRIPMMIKTNGLGATFAFIFSKGCKDGTPNKDTAYGLIFWQVADWLMSERAYLIPNLSEERRLVEEIVALESDEYRALTNEIFTLFGWLRRFAEGLISKQNSNNGEANW